MTVSKGLTSGYSPLGATIVSDDVSEAFAAAADRGVLAHGHTYGGHPVSCAVALANLDIIESEGLVNRSALMGAYLLEGLRSGFAKCPTVWDVRGWGLLIGVELAGEESGSPLPHPGTVGSIVRQKCKANGLITLPLHPGTVMFFAPPLTITEPQLDDLIDRFSTSLSELEPELLRLANE